MIKEIVKKYPLISLGITVSIIIIIVVVVVTSNNRNETNSTESGSNQLSSGESSRTTTSRPTTTSSPTTTSRLITTAAPTTTSRLITTAAPTTTSRLITTAAPTTTSRLITTAAPTTIVLTPEEQLCTSSDVELCPLSNDDLLNHEFLCSFRRFNNNDIPWFKCLKNAYYKFYVDSSVNGDWSIRINPSNTDGHIGEGSYTPAISNLTRTTITNNDIDTNNEYYFPTNHSGLGNFTKRTNSTIIRSETNTIQVLENNGFKGRIELYFKDRTKFRRLFIRIAHS